MPFDIEVRSSDQEATLSLSGELDLAEAPKLLDAFDELFAAGIYRLTVDCKELTFLDSTGIRALVGAHKVVLDKAGDLRLTGPCEQVTKALHITGLDQMIEVI